MKSNYLQSLIPVDEFLPIMYGESTKANFEGPRINALAVVPTIVDIDETAFTHSETVHSPPFKSTNKEEINIEMWGIASERNCGVERFEEYCQIYGIPFKIIGLGTEWVTDMAKGPGGGQKILILQDALAKETNDEKIIIVSDTYDAFPVAPQSEILKKFATFSSKVVFSAEYSCWPDASKASEYPMIDETLPRFLNSGGFIGKVKDIQSLISPVKVSPYDDDQRVWTSLFLSLNSITLDYRSTIFQTLNGVGDTIKVNHRKNRVTNSLTNEEPCILHGNGPPRIKLSLNYLERYTGNGWNQNYGYQKTFDKQFNNEDDYYYARYKDELSTMEMQVIDFLTCSTAKYFVHFNENNVHLKPSALTQISSRVDRYGVVAPLLKKRGAVWSNFWGDIDSKGFYKRSDDYFAIVNNERRGVWNVPYVSECIIFHRDVIERYPDLYTDGDGDVDMRICANLRRKGQFMYVDNLHDYGYLESPLRLEDFNERREEWEAKYLHPNFLEDAKELALNTDVFLFSAFTPTFCQEIIERAEAYGQWSGGKDNHNDPRIGGYENFPTQDIHLTQLGLGEMWESVTKTHFSRAASTLYSPYLTKGVNIAFIVKYQPEGQKELVEHHDSSTYTLNIALNDGYEGGGSYFVRQKLFNQQQPIGTATIHPGKLTHYHRGLETTKGTRYILVTFVN
jgi:hypothetical protein